MFVLTRRSALPRLRLVPGAVARYHDDQITLFSLPAALETGLAAQPLPGGSYGVILNVGSNPPSPTVIAQYPTLALARRQLRQLAGDHGWGWAGGLGRGLLAAALLFLIWFLFFLPVDFSSLSATAPGSGAALALDDPAEAVRAPAAYGPAFIDDPAESGDGSGADTAGPGTEPVPAR